SGVGDRCLAGSCLGLPVVFGRRRASPSMLGAIWRSPLVASGRCGVPSTNYPHRGSFPTMTLDAEGGEGLSAETVTQSAELWTRCSKALRDQVSESTWQLWLSGLEPATFADGVFTLSVPNGLIRERVESRYLPMIEDTLANEVGVPVRGRLEVRETEAEQGSSSSESPGQQPGISSPAEPDLMPDPTSATAPALAGRPGRDS